MTGRFGIVTAEFGSVTDDFGDVTDGILMPVQRRFATCQGAVLVLRMNHRLRHRFAPFWAEKRCHSNAWTYA